METDQQLQLSAQSKATVDKKPRIITFPNADVTFRSCDGSIFAVDKRRLAYHAEGFPPCELATSLDDEIPLSEDATTLQLLFQSMYPRCMPDFKSLSFQTILNLANAAEKYEVATLMYLCNTQIRATLPNHANDILAYAARYDYPEIISDIAPQMIDKPFTEMYQTLPPRYFSAWAKYVDHWHRVHRSALQAMQTQTPCTCDTASNASIILAIFRRLANLRSLQKLDATFDAAPASPCTASIRPAVHMANYLAQWKGNVKKDVESIPKFIELLSG